MSKQDLVAAEVARAELHETLELLAYKLDYPTRIDNALRRGKEKFMRQRKENPAVFYGVSGAAVVAIAAGVAGVVFAVTKRFSR